MCVPVIHFEILKIKLPSGWEAGEIMDKGWRESGTFGSYLREIEIISYLVKAGKEIAWRLRNWNYDGAYDSVIHYSIGCIPYFVHIIYLLKERKYFDFTRELWISSKAIWDGVINLRPYREQSEWWLMWPGKRQAWLWETILWVLTC